MEKIVKLFIISFLILIYMVYMWKDFVDFCKYSARKFKDRKHDSPILSFLLSILIFGIVMPFIKIYEDVSALPGKIRMRRAQKRLEKMPLAYVNYVNGIKVAVEAKSYDRAKNERQKALVDGRIVDARRPLRVEPVWLFRHASAKLASEDLNRFMWLSDFEKALEGYRVEKRNDLYVPFVSKKTWQEDRGMKHFDKIGIVRY